MTKLRGTPHGAPACPWPLYAPGAWDGALSLPANYSMDGYLAADPRRSHRILLDLYVRCGIAARGYFTSSPICTIQGDEITTYNSVWKILHVPPFDPVSYLAQDDDCQAGDDAAYG
jgi:hypothetical protein